MLHGKLIFGWATKSCHSSLLGGCCQLGGGKLKLLLPSCYTYYITHQKKEVFAQLNPLYRDASKICHILYIRKPIKFFRCLFWVTLNFTLVYVDKDGKIQSCLKWKTEKNYMGFLMHKIWQILKHFSRALSWEQTSYLWGVIYLY